MTLNFPIQISEFPIKIVHLVRGFSEAITQFPDFVGPIRECSLAIRRAKDCATQAVEYALAEFSQDADKGTFLILSWTLFCNGNLLVLLVNRIGIWGWIYSRIHWRVYWGIYWEICWGKMIERHFVCDARMDRLWTGPFGPGLDLSSAWDPYDPSLIFWKDVAVVHLGSDEGVSQLDFWSLTGKRTLASFGMAPNSSTPIARNG